MVRGRSSPQHYAPIGRERRFGLPRLVRQMFDSILGFTRNAIGKDPKILLLSPFNAMGLHRRGPLGGAECSRARRDILE